MKNTSGNKLATKIAIVTLLMLAALVFSIATDRANAAGPLTISFLTTGTMFTPANGGDIIIVAVQGINCIGNGNPGACTGAGTGVTSITDTQSTSYTQQVKNVLNNQACFSSASNWNCDDEIWTGKIAAASATTITITFSGGGGSSGQVHQIYDAANAVGAAVCTAIGNGTSGTSMTTATNCGPTSGQGTVASYLPANAGSISLPAWASNIVPACCSSVDGASAYSSSFTGSTNFPGTQSIAGPWQDVGVVLNGIPVTTVTQTTTVTKVVACNFYQEQCWWEPTIFYGMYVGLWVVIAASINVRARSLTFILGAATSYASLYLIILGELPYPFAIISFAAALVYALRLDGVF